MQIANRARFTVAMSVLGVVVVLVAAELSAISTLVASNAYVTLALVTIGLVGTAFTIVGRKQLFSAAGLDSVRYNLAVATYGIGGAGKTTLLDRMLLHSGKQLIRTRRIEESWAPVVYGGRTHRVKAIDIVGDEEREFRVNFLHDPRNRPARIEVLFVVFSFYPIKGDDVDETELMIPSESSENRVTRREHSFVQIRHYNRAVVRDLVLGIPGLKCVCLVINHINLLPGHDNVERISVASKEFASMRKEFARALENQGISLELVIADAKAGVLYRNDGEEFVPLSTLLHTFVERYGS